MALMRRNMGGVPSREGGRCGGLSRARWPTSVPLRSRTGIRASSARSLAVMAPHTLASRIVQMERADFIGRRRELLVADTLFSDHAAASILLVHGPTGVGKSVLLREIGRRGRDAGWTPVPLDAAGTVERPLVSIDDYEGDGAELRAGLPALPASAVVLIASREAPDAAWHEGGWET